MNFISKSVVNLFSNLDSNLTQNQVISKYGFDSQNFTFETEDGYINTCVRVFKYERSDFKNSFKTEIKAIQKPVIIL